MKSLNKLSIVLLIIFTFLSISAMAQNDPRAARSRKIVNDYVEKKVQGLRVWVSKKEGEKFVPVFLDANDEFKTGDRIQVEFESNFGGYVYIVNVDPAGEMTVIYPLNKDGNLPLKVKPDERMIVPAHKKGFTFTEGAGTEILQVIVSVQPIPFFDDAIKNSDGGLGKTAKSVANEFAKAQSGIDENTLAKVGPSDGRGTIRSRKIELAPADDTGAGGSVVISRPDPQTKTLDLKPGEGMIFEMRFKHVAPK